MHTMHYILDITSRYAYACITRTNFRRFPCGSVLQRPTKLHLGFAWLCSLYLGQPRPVHLRALHTCNKWCQVSYAKQTQVEAHQNQHCLTSENSPSHIQTSQEAWGMVQPFPSAFQTAGAWFAPITRYDSSCLVLQHVSQLVGMTLPLQWCGHAQCERTWV